jgi:hypothetical protein
MATFPGGHVSTDVTRRGVKRRLFKSSAGRFFHFAKVDAATDTLSVARATDPTGTWTQITTNAPTAGSTDAIGGIAGHQDGDTIHVAFFSHTGNLQRSFYARFDMAASSGDGAWVDLGTSDYDIEIEITATHTGNQGLAEAARGIDIVKRPNGDLIVVYQGNRHRDMGKNYANIVFQISSNDGVSWSGLSAITIASGAIHYTGPNLVVTEAGRVYCFHTEPIATDLEGSLLRATDTVVSTASPDNFDDTLDNAIAGIEYAVGPAISWRDSSGVPRVGVPYADVNGNATIKSIVDGDDLAGSTSTLLVDVTANDVFQGEFVAGLALLADGPELYLVFNDATDNNLKYDLDDSADVQITAMSAGDYGDAYAIYDDDGPKLGCVYMNTGTGFDYIEVDIAKSTTSLADVRFPDQNFFIGPYET